MTKIIDLPTVASTDANTFVPVYKDGKTQKVSVTALGSGGSGLDLTSVSNVTTVDGTEYLPVNKPLGTILRLTVQRILDWILARANTWTGVQTFGSVNVSSLVSTSGVLGYGTGSGGTVTQTTSKFTAVTINKVSGIITTTSDALGANAVAAFQLNNSTITASDSVVVTFVDGNGLSYSSWAYAMNTGNCQIAIKNITSGSLSHALPLRFTVIKGSSA